MLVFTLQANGTFQPTVTQLSSSEGNSYSASQLLAFLSSAKPGTMEAQQVDGNTVRITLKPRYDLAVEAAEPVVINAKGDYHVGTSKDVILKDITVGGTLYVYAGRDVINQTAAASPVRSPAGCTSTPGATSARRTTRSRLPTTAPTR